MEYQLNMLMNLASIPSSTSNFDHIINLTNWDHHLPTFDANDTFLVNSDSESECQSIKETATYEQKPVNCPPYIPMIPKRIDRKDIIVENKWTEDLIEDLICPICMCLCEEPRLCNPKYGCSTKYCEKCISRHLQDSRRCPKCRKPLKIQYIDRILRNQQNELKLKCEFCEDIITYGSINTHIQNCEFWLYKCSGCKLQSTAENMKKHILECVNIEWKCKFAEVGCEFSGNKEAVSLHEDSCGYIPMNCSDCKKLVLTFQMSKHKLKCSEICVECKDCCFKLKRKMLRRHKCANEIFKALKIPNKRKFWEKEQSNPRQYIWICIIKLICVVKAVNKYKTIPIACY